MPECCLPECDTEITVDWQRVMSDRDGNALCVEHAREREKKGLDSAGWEEMLEHAQ